MMVAKFGENLPFPRWVIFQVNHVHPTDDSTAKGTGTAITTHYLERNFMIIWSSNLQGSSGFIRQQILPTCTQKPKKSPFSVVSLKFPSPFGCMKRRLLQYEVSEGRRGETAIGVAWQTREFFDPGDFFGAGRWRPTKIGERLEDIWFLKLGNHHFQILNMSFLDWRFPTWNRQHVRLFACDFEVSFHRVCHKGLSNTVGGLLY